MPINTYDIFVTCPKSLEELLADELRALGLAEVRQTVAGCYAKGDLECVYQVALWSRLANRLLLVLETARVECIEEFDDVLYQIPWSRHFSAGETFCVDFSGQSSWIRHTGFGAMRVKDALVDHFRDQCGVRPSVERKEPDYRINVRLQKGKLTVALDFAGCSLHQRGYRLQGGKAPLKENLAAAILLRARWPEVMEQGGTLLDPMCGSGTLLSEAAMMAANVAPGLLRRSHSFELWSYHDEQLWQRLCDEAKKQRISEPTLRIIGFDAEGKALASAQRNLQRSGLAGWVKLEQRDVDNLCAPADVAPGLLLTNPPYGERLGDFHTLRQLYRRLGQQLKAQFSGWRAAIFTSNDELAKAIPLRAAKRYRMYNGALECQLHLYEIDANFAAASPEPKQPSPASNVEATETSPSLPAASIKLDEQGQMFANRLKKNVRNLSKWVKKNEIECYRLYDADLPEFAVAIDRYGDHLHVQEYVAPASVDSRKAAHRLAMVLDVLPEVTGIDSANIALKQRQRQKGKEQYRKQQEQREWFPVREGEGQFLVNMTDYLDTGLFLDHRPARLKIASMAAGKSFLNLFCYTSTASVHAALGGASRSVSVDLSPTYIDWSKRNFELNSMDLAKHELVQGDCLQWLRDCREEYDLILLDPPSFSNSKRTETVLDIQRDHAELIELSMLRLTAYGTLLFSNNLRSFRMDQAVIDRYKVTDISGQTIDKDFARRSNIHRCWTIEYRG